MTDSGSAQMRLPLAAEPALGPDDFVTDLFNGEVVRRLGGWRAWPGGALALCGQEGSGKTHLALVWAKEANALRLAPDAAITAIPSPGRPVLVEDADRLAVDDETLFHLINRAAQGAGALLLTGRTAPADWRAGLPDLRSRLNALPVAELGPPGESLLRQLLIKFFRERSIKPGDGLLDYLARRIERSAPAARAVVERLDAEAPDHRVGLSLARSVLGEGFADDAAERD